MTEPYGPGHRVPRWLPLLCLLTLGAAEPARTPHPALAGLPATLLWAWERPEDLRWLPADMGVAYVASTLELEGDRVYKRPRGRFLKVDPATARVPVVHVDASWRRPPTLDATQREAIVAAVVEAAAAGNRRVVQLDFEVRRSQRAFLADVVAHTRQRLPGDVALSVTALTSWCAGDYWLAGLAADEIVPMAFRMASDDRNIRELLARQGRFTRNGCTEALGTASDEPAIAARAPRRYYFSPRPWTPETWQRTNAQATS